MRLFVAIELDDALRKPLLRLLDERLPTNRNVRWVSPGQLHLTLKFIGELPSEKLPEVKAALEPVGPRFTPFSIRLTEYGVFPNPARARVFWVGVRDAGDDCGQIAKAVDEALATVDIPAEDRPFKPHITLGRAKTPAGTPILRDAAQRLAKPGSEQGFVSHFTLFESQLSKRGAVYRPVHSVAFGD